jgi:hypothetical protein
LLSYRSAERRKTCSHDMRLANQCNIIEIPSRTHHPPRLLVICPWSAFIASHAAAMHGCKRIAASAGLSGRP